nr:HNH endonuclease family protein [Gemmobacter straminiformis]
MQTRSYGTLSLKLLRTVLDSDGQDVPALIKAQLLGLDGTDEWPSDEAFEREWMRRQFYGYFRRERVLMILRALEHHYQSSNGKSEPLMTFDWSKLQIEHILPQTWQPNWPLTPEVTAEERKANIQGIGNLTLVSQALNPTLSNAAWIGSDTKPGKREALHKYAMMQINRRLLDEFGENWSDETIKQRAKMLFEDAKIIWPK